jgi:glyoxylase-like metal-dependent hydrolase (beta-lactamase superfamily II)
MLKIGAFELHWLEGGQFRLDGGAMFGPVPKVLWARAYPPDDQNTIALAARPLLVRTPKGTNILIETGLGNKLPDKLRRIYHVGPEWDLPGSLAALGLTRDEIHYVVLTHCDFDHAGGVMMHPEAGGEPELTFPRAVHVAQYVEWADAMKPNRRSASTYFPENFTHLADGTGKLRIVDGDVEIVPGITTRLTRGHTRGHQAVRIESEGQVAWHLSDLLPTHAHTNPLWVMAYDNFPLDVIEQKAALLAEARNENAWLTFYHDVFMDAARLDERGRVIERYPAYSR